MFLFQTQPFNLGSSGEGEKTTKYNTPVDPDKLNAIVRSGNYLTVTGETVKGKTLIDDLKTKRNLTWNDVKETFDKFHLLSKYYDETYDAYQILQQAQKITARADDWFAPAEAAMRYDMARRAKETWEQDQDIVKVREKAQAPKKK